MVLVKSEEMGYILKCGATAGACCRDPKTGDLLPTSSDFDLQFDRDFHDPLEEGHKILLSSTSNFGLGGPGVSRGLPV